MHQPSGQQLTLAHGDYRAVVTEVGAGLRICSYGGNDLLDGFAADEMCRSGRGQVLIPWPNRIDGGSYEWNGRRLQLPLTEVENGNAIHGLVRWAQWRVQGHTTDQVALTHRVFPQPGYPFELDLTIEYELAERGLTIRTTATNMGAEACPFGAGAHPYLTLGPVPVDGLRLRLPACAVLESDERGIPTGETAVEGSGKDFRAERTIGATVLDHCFTDLIRDDDGFAHATLSGDAGTLDLWVDAGYTHLMAFTGDPLPDVTRRAVAVEPMTCPPNAFASGSGLIRLEPGESMSLAWGLQFTPAG